MIPGLDGLRAIAFLLVFGLHTEYLEIGWVGVQLFFVLSGFLITDILLKMKESLPVGRYFIKFYGRRFLRIFPLYYFYLILMTLIAVWFISIGFRPGYMKVYLDQAVYAFFYAYDFISALDWFRGSRFMDHLWSLSVEEQFYIVWPLLILLVPNKSLRKLYLGFIALGAVFRLGVFLVYHLKSFSFLRDPASLAIYPLPFSHIDAFAMGAYITRFPIPKAKTQLFTLCFILPAIGYGSLYTATGNIGAPLAFGFPVTLPDAYQFLWAYSLLNYFFTLVVYCVAKEGLFVRFLDHKVLKYLGKISYGLYVYHFPIIWFAMRIRGLGIEEPLVRPLTALITFIATLAMATLSYRLMEKPLINLKDKFFPLPVV